jgi:subtilisin-like proprotein convertase family protein
MKWAFVAVLVVALNVSIAVLVVGATESAGRVDAQATTTCDPSGLAVLESRYLDVIAGQAAGTIRDARVVERARGDLATAIRLCSAEIDVDKVRYDNDYIWLNDSRFVLTGSKWGANSPFNTPPATAGGTVTYSFMANGVSLSPAHSGNQAVNVAITSLPTYQACFLDEIRGAFEQWESIANIQFVEVPDNGVSIDAPNAQGHIRIGAHTVNGVGGELAHAYFPPPNGFWVSVPGDLHFDVAENWQCSPGAGQFDIGTVMLHEIGHSIGLLHEPTVLAVMNAFYNPALPTLQTDDITGAVSIYGSNPNVTFPPLATITFEPAAIEQTLAGGGAMQIEITNPNSTLTLTGIEVEHLLPTGLQVVPTSLTHNCTGATPNVTPSQLQLTGFSLSAIGSCTLSIKVTGVNLGTFSNAATTAANESGSAQGQSAAVSLRVIEPATGTYCATTHDPTWTAPRAIPDGNQNTGVTSTIVVPDNLTLADLDVRVNVAHTYVGDLDIRLTHNGVPVNLIDSPNGTSGVCSGNNVFIAFDDETGLSAQTSCSNLSSSDAYVAGGSYRPAQALSAFDNQNISGNWQLRLTDAVLTDAGHLVNWCLRPTVRVPARVVFSAQPTTTLAGGTINAATGGVKVQLQDATGNNIVDNGVPITLALAPNPAGGTLTGTLTVNTVNGVATFSDLSIDQFDDAYQLVATSGVLISATSGAFEIAPAPNRNLIRNSTFASDLAFWGVYATPNLDDIQHGFINGLFQAYRTIDATSAVVLQNTGVPIGGNVPIEVDIQLANTSSNRQRVLMMAHHANFSDFQICSFWLPPNAPLQTYQLRAKTNVAWTDGASLSVYLATGDETGYVQIDNARMVYAPGTPPTVTRCIDPNLPP